MYNIIRDKQSTKQKLKSNFYYVNTIPFYAAEL